MIEEKQFFYNTSLVSKLAFENHKLLYRGYVSSVNDIKNNLTAESIRGQSNKNYSYYRSLKKEESYNLNSVILHELFFNNIGDGNTKPGKRFHDLVEKHFGSLEAWAKDFMACATSARGWCMAGYERRTGCLINVLQDAYNTDMILGIEPLVVLDLYEHGYISDYDINVQKYINTFMKVISWQTVEERMVAHNVR